jgi:CheY-like chemotaxis protein
VESGREALLALSAAPTRFSLILTDVAMPEVNGLHVLRYVRSQPALHALPVVMMSAHENAGTGARRGALRAAGRLRGACAPREGLWAWRPWLTRAAARASL